MRLLPNHTILYIYISVQQEENVDKKSANGTFYKIGSCRKKEVSTKKGG